MLRLSPNLCPEPLISISSPFHESILKFALCQYQVSRVVGIQADIVWAFWAPGRKHKHPLGSLKLYHVNGGKCLISWIVCTGQSHWILIYSESLGVEFCLFIPNDQIPENLIHGKGILRNFKLRRDQNSLWIIPWFCNRVLITPLPISTLQVLLAQILWCPSYVVLCIYRFRVGAGLGWSECSSSHCWFLGRAMVSGVPSLKQLGWGGS